MHHFKQKYMLFYILHNAALEYLYIFSNCYARRKNRTKFVDNVNSNSRTNVLQSKHADAGGQRMNEKKIIELIRRSNNPEEAIRVALALLATLLGGQETNPASLSEICGTTQ